MCGLGVVTAAGALLGLVGMAWLAPLMVDQLTFFAAMWVITWLVLSWTDRG